MSRLLRSARKCSRPRGRYERTPSNRQFGITANTAANKNLPVPPQVHLPVVEGAARDDARRRVPRGAVGQGPVVRVGAGVRQRAAVGGDDAVDARVHAGGEERAGAVAAERVDAPAEAERRDRRARPPQVPEPQVLVVGARRDAAALEREDLRVDASEGGTKKVSRTEVTPASCRRDAARLGPGVRGSQAFNVPSSAPE